MPDLSSARTPWLRVIVVVGLLTFSGVTLASNVIPTRDGLRDTRQMAEEQEAENERSRERIRELHDEADALHGDRWTINRVLREEFNRTDEGEIRVR